MSKMQMTPVKQADSFFHNARSPSITHTTGLSPAVPVNSYLQ